MEELINNLKGTSLIELEKLINDLEKLRGSIEKMVVTDESK